MTSDIGNLINDVLKKDNIILRSLRDLKVDFKNSTPNVGRGNGTTILAMRYDGGVLLAGDRRTTDYHTHTDESVKVEETENLAAIGFAGTVSFIQEAKEALDTLISRLESIIETPIYVDGQAKLMKNILKTNFDYFKEMIYVLQYYGVPILAGIDPNLKKGRIFEFDESGGIYEKDTYATTGSGGQIAKVVLDDRWKVGMKEIEAVELAARALYLASSDNYTSHPALAPITALSISEKGISSLNESDALKLGMKNFMLDLKRKGYSKKLKFFMGEG